MNFPWRAATLAASIALGSRHPHFAIAQQRSPLRCPGLAPASKDPFGVEVTLTPKTIIFMKGNSTWDKALETFRTRSNRSTRLIDSRASPRPARR